MSKDPDLTLPTATLTFSGSVQALSQILAHVQAPIPQKNKTRTKLRLTHVSPGPSSAAAPAVVPSSSLQTATATVSPAATPVAATTEHLSYEHVSEATLKLVAEKGKPAAVAVLESFGVTNARALTEAQWRPYLGAIITALRG